MKMQSRKLLLIASGVVLLSSLGLLINQGPEKKWPILGASDKSGELRLIHEEQVALNQPFEVDVEIDTLGNNVNAAGFYLRFDPNKLRLLDLDSKQSFCQFYPEKKFDNNLGTISLACGSPHPGLKGNNTLLKLTFLPIGVGLTSLRTEKNSQLLLSDGKGTDILDEFPQTTVNIVSSF